MNIDLLTCSGHKLYGPKGVGALYVRRSNPHVKAACQINGGGHERGFRSGTLNVPGIVGFAAAVKIARSEMKKENARTAKMRDTLQVALLEAIPAAKVNGHMEQRVSGNLNICFPGVESEALIIRLKDEVAFSSGSACTTAAIQPSHVLKELGMDEDDIYSSVRFGIGRFNSQGEMEKLIPEIIEAVTELQAFSF
jgi:cysteine desulfurase